MSLFIGYNLQGYLDGIIVCPSQTLLDPITGSSSIGTSNPAFWRWFQQDNLILHAIIVFVFKLVLPFIATSSTTRDAWLKLQRLYANRPRTLVMQLKEELTLIH